MKKRLAPFFSGIGAGLCLAVVILAVWGLVLPNHENVQAGGLNQENQGVSETDTGDVPAEGADAQAEPQDAVPAEPAGEGTTTSTSDTPKKEGYRVVEITAGMTATEIGVLLEQEGVIDSAQQFHDVVVQYKKTQKFIAGRFTLRYGAPYEELLAVLTSQPNS